PFFSVEIEKSAMFPAPPPRPTCGAAGAGVVVVAGGVVTAAPAAAVAFAPRPARPPRPFPPAPPRAATPPGCSRRPPGVVRSGLNAFHVSPPLRVTRMQL